MTTILVINSKQWPLSQVCRFSNSYISDRKSFGLLWVSVFLIVIYVFLNVTDTWCGYTVNLS